MSSLDTEQLNIVKEERLSADQLVQIDLLLLFHKNIPTILAASFFGAGILALVVTLSGKLIISLAWLVVFTGILLLRFFHYKRFDVISASLRQIDNFIALNTTLITCSGLAWGAAGLLFFDREDVGTYSFLILTLLAIVSGSMNSLSSLRKAFPRFALTAMCPIVLITLFQGTTFYFLMGTATVVYIAGVLQFHRNSRQAITTSLELKYENRELIKNLKIQTEMAEKANFEKSRFLAAASHDLRQPMHAINLFSEALENSQLNDYQNEVLGHIKNGLDSMGELFDALLDISGIDSNSIPINKSHFNLGILIGKLITQSQLELQSTDVTLSHRNCNFTVHTDPIFLERILGNIISNAIRYTEAGSIEIFCEEVKKDCVEISIRDSGIGIAPENQEAIFEEFTQLNNSERDRRKGLGLGLAIVKRLAQQLDLKIAVESEEGKGSTFSVEVSKGDAELSADSSARVDAAMETIHGSHALIVDNEIEIVEAMKLLLEDWGCKVTMCTSTEEALKLVSNGLTPQLIISDLRMPGELDGVEFVLAVRKTLVDIPALIISGDTSVELVEDVQKNDLLLLHKPIRPAQLNIAMTQLMT